MTSYYTFFSLVFVFIYKLRCIFGDENILIDLRKLDKPQVFSDFKYDQLITDEQIALFHLDGDNAADFHQKAFPHMGRPICAVLKGLCNNGKNLYIKRDNSRNPETRVYVRVDEDFKNINYSKVPEDFQFLSSTFTNNGTKRIKWSPKDEFTYPTRVRRTHSLEKNKKAWSLEAGVTFLNIITTSGSSIQYELSEWFRNSSRAKPFQLNTGNIYEVMVDPGETVEFYTAYTEKSTTLELTYRMTIDDDNTYHVELEKEYNSTKLWRSRPDFVLNGVGMPTSFNHHVNIEITYATDIVHMIKEKHPLKMK